MWYCTVTHVVVLARTYLIGSPNSATRPFTWTVTWPKLTAWTRLSFSSLQRRAPRSGTIAAKAMILFEWKSASHPRFKRSRNELLLVANLERTWCDKGTKGIFFYLDPAKHPVLFCYSNSQRFVHTHQDKTGAGRILHSPSS